MGGKKRSFHDAGLALIVPTRDMNSAYFIVPLGTVEKVEFGSARILMISSGVDFCFETAR